MCVYKGQPFSEGRHSSRVMLGLEVGVRLPAWGSLDPKALLKDPVLISV